MYTTGILAQNGAHQIALIYNSQRHSGENMERLLNKSPKNKGVVIQMCDALSHNIPETHDTIVCNCLSHGFRKFDELQAFYPEHCLPIMKWLSIPFKMDEESKQLGMMKSSVRSKELAEAVGITEQNLSILITGKAKAVRLSTLDAICNYLSCQPGDILEITLFRSR